MVGRLSTVLSNQWWALPPCFAATDKEVVIRGLTWSDKVLIVCLFLYMDAFCLRYCVPNGAT